MSDIDDIRKRDAESGALWFTGPVSFTAQSARDRRALLVEYDRLRGACESAIEWLSGWKSAEPYISVLRDALGTAVQPQVCPMAGPKRAVVETECSVCKGEIGKCPDVQPSATVSAGQEE